MKTAYYETKAKIVALAAGYYEGDEATRDHLRKKADFFPVSRADDDTSGLRSMIIRIHGEIFLVEDTRGGETGVFSLLLPIM
ncbi:MAG: hypothetical protein V4689_07835 [Verrucomicrobiota bacterium]